MTTRRRAPIELFWWSPTRDVRTAARYLKRHGRSVAEMARYGSRGVHNFGDELSPLVLEAVTGRRVQWSSPRRAEVFGIGSILEIAAREANSLIWGSGLREALPEGSSISPDRFLAVRGPLSRSAVGAPTTCPLGDPGLLVRTLSRPRKRRHGIVLIPHYSSFARSSERALISHADSLGWRVVPPMRRGPEVLDAIGSADLVLSSSLHGVVTAQALDIPSVLVTLGTGSEPAFKYADHYAALGVSAVHVPLTDFFDTGPEAHQSTAEAELDHTSTAVDALVEGLTRTAERLR